MAKIVSPENAEVLRQERRDRRTNARRLAEQTATADRAPEPLSDPKGHPIAPVPVAETSEQRKVCEDAEAALHHSPPHLGGERGPAAERRAQEEFRRAQLAREGR